jgi:hypothetical protein
MANDPPPPPPSRWQKFFSARNEGKDVLIEAPGTLDVHPVPAPPLAYDRASDNEALFIECMPDAARRRIAFNVVERNCLATFARGEEGLALFMKVRRLVERAQVEEAVSEFDKRFAPMLDQVVLNIHLDPAPPRH